MYEVISLSEEESILVHYNPPFLNTTCTCTLGRSCNNRDVIMETWDLLDEVLRYGLFLGAIFQIIAIAAIVIIPPKETKEVNDRDEGSLKDKSAIKHENKQHNVSSVRKRTKDKKKR